MKKSLLCILLLAALFRTGRADEGFWMIQQLAEVERNMQTRGLQLPVGRIYDAALPAASLTGAVVSIGFHDSGCVLSAQGLILTSYRCAVSHFDRIRSAAGDLPENGFWASGMRDEIPVPGERIYFLQKIVDVTSEAKALAELLETAAPASADRCLRQQLEKRYADATGLEARLHTVWGGEKYYLHLYKVFTDLRLVAVPPRRIGGFGGTDDAGRWPRHSVDFALYRVYDNGVPVPCSSRLSISTAGYLPGTYTMMIGFPGRSYRTLSGAGTKAAERSGQAFAGILRANRLHILHQWMRAAPEIRQRYADRYTALCRKRLYDASVASGFERFAVSAEKQAQDRSLQRWIDADAGRKAIWGGLLPELDLAYSRSARDDFDRVCLAETLFGGTFIGEYGRQAGTAKTVEEARASLLNGYRTTDRRVEGALLSLAFKEYFTRMDYTGYGAMLNFLQERFGTDYADMADYLWSRSLLVSEERIRNVKTLDEVRTDPLCRLFSETVPPPAAGTENRIPSLEQEYRRARYWQQLEEGSPAHPDADASMRLSFGTAGGYEPQDAVWLSGLSTTDGLLAMADPQQQDVRLQALLQARKWGKWGQGGAGRIPVNFLTDNDVTEDCAGSPLLNARGELIGLVSGPNPEALVGEFYYPRGHARSINTDIRFVLWVLDKYAGMKWILKEMEIRR